MTSAENPTHGKHNIQQSTAPPSARSLGIGKPSSARRRVAWKRHCAKDCVKIVHHPNPCMNYRSA